MINAAALLVELLDAFSQLLREQALNESGGAIAPHDQTTRQIVTELDEHIGDIDLPTALGNGMIRGWWEKIRQRSSNIQIRALYQLLYRLDSHFGALPLAVVPLRVQRYLALGPKFWSRGTKPRPPKDNRTYFPCLRLSGRVPIQYLPSHHAVNSGMRSAGRKLKIRLHALRTGTTPFFTPTGVLDEVSRTMGFRLEELRYLGAGMDYGEEIAAVVRKAHADGVHVICLPELTVGGEGRGRIEAELAATANGAPFLVVAGSNHDPRGHGYENAGPIYVKDGSNAVVWGRYAKREPFSLAVTQMGELPGLAELRARCAAERMEFAGEHIVPSPHYTVFRTPAGLAAVVICKDALVGEEEFAELCRFVDHIFVLSLQSTRDWFKPRLRQASTLHGVGCYYVNTQHAASRQVECAGWAIPVSRAPGEFFFRHDPSGDAPQPQVCSEGYVDLELDLMT